MEITITDFIAGLSLLVSVGLAVYAGYNSNRLKTLESSLEIQKNKALLNDKVNREIFAKFIQLYLDLLLINREDLDKNEKKSKDLEIKKEMLEVKKFLFINGSGELVKKFLNFIFITQKENTTDIEMYASFDEFSKQFRSDIGVNNDGLKENDLIQLFVNEKIKI